MSIIERVAELLEPVDAAGPRPAESTPRPADSTVPPTIERAANADAPISLFAKAGSHATRAESGAAEPGARVEPLLERPPQRDAEIHRVDRVRMRRQGIITPEGDRTANAESFRRIKRQILANLAKPKSGLPANLVLMTSALSGEGKTFCAVSLAVSMALELDRTVLLVDADVAKPSIPAALGLEAQRGLLDVLVEPRTSLSDVLCKTDIGKLTVLPAGTPQPNATELMASAAMRRLLQEIAERYQDRVVIFDSPPLLAASEAAVLASQMGQIIIVVEAGRTSESALMASLARIETGNITGLLLNKGEDPGSRHHYGEYGKFAK